MLQQPGDAQQRLALLPHGVRPLAPLAGRADPGAVRRSGQDRLPARRGLCLRSGPRRLHLLAAQPPEVPHAEHRAERAERLAERGGRIRPLQAALPGLLARHVRSHRRADHGRPPREAGDLRAADGQRQPVQRVAGDGRQDAAAAGHGPHRPLGAGLAGHGAGPQGDRRAAPRTCLAWPKCSAPIPRSPTWPGWATAPACTSATATRSCRSIRPCCTRCNCPCWATCRSGSKARPRRC